MRVMKWSMIALAVSAGTSQFAMASAQDDAKGFVEDSLYINWELMVINDNDYNISVSDGWGDKLSINDYMVDYTMWEEYINAHETSFAEIQISKDGLEEIGITRDQFQNLEISLEVHDENYRTIANPTVSMTVNQ